MMESHGVMSEVEDTEPAKHHAPLCIVVTFNIKNNDLSCINKIKSLLETFVIYISFFHVYSDTCHV